MADRSIFHDDTQDDSDEGVFEQGDLDGDDEDDLTKRAIPDDAKKILDEGSTSSLLKLIKSVALYESKHLHGVCDVRWPGLLVKCIQNSPAEHLNKDIGAIMDFLSKYTRSTENIRKFITSFLMEVPAIATLAKKRSTEVPALANIVGEYLLPIVLNYLSPPSSWRNPQDSKTAQTVLIQLLKEGFITNAQMEIQVCPSILALTSSDEWWFLKYGIIFMAKLLPFLGRDITERVFLDRYIELFSAQKYMLRRAAVSIFGALTGVIGRAAFEKFLFPAYLKLFSDKSWAVRKSAVDVSILASAACTSEVRRDVLTPVFLKMFHDSCYYVRRSAHRVVGVFISTFSEKETPTVYYDESDALIWMSHGIEYEVNSIILQEEGIYFALWRCPLPGLRYTNCESCAAHDLCRPTKYRPKMTMDMLLDMVKNKRDTKKKKREGNSEEDLELFNSYYYWHVPPDMPLDPEILASCDSSTVVKPTNAGDETIEKESAAIPKCLPNSDTESHNPNGDIINSSDKDALKSIDSFCLSNNETEICEPNETITSAADSTYILAETGDGQEQYSEITSTTTNPEVIQTILPQELLDCFIAMPEIATSYVINAEDVPSLSYGCAFSLPAVALTLEKNHFQLLYGLMKRLYKEGDIYVKQSLASGLHVLASIWGSEIASRELLELLCEILSSGSDESDYAMRNIAEFLKHVDPCVRSTIFPALRFANKAVDWRRQYDGVLHMRACITLFAPNESFLRVSNITVYWLLSRVAAIRDAAIELSVDFLRHMSSEPGLTSRLLIKYVEHFAHSKEWKLRQTYAMLASKIFVAKALPMDEFACSVLPHFLDLSWDPVVNIRLVVARTIASDMIYDDFFHDPENQESLSLQSVLRRLQVDKDSDVRNCASPNSCPKKYQLKQF